ncbi:hypothetical protein [Streptomyces sp. 769]|uniref:hypothetical protein n=1 Tax=Streptomyces sp. 769 TaxID=1262452 RepID=UPI00057F4EDF|nr:hypothetical protein [Streptomyces sp. 769]AJC53991.1 hypothetical protein GZL_01391 [Streptomyces sp. 769]
MAVFEFRWDDGLITTYKTDADPLGTEDDVENLLPGLHDLQVTYYDDDGKLVGTAQTDFYIPAPTGPTLAPIPAFTVGTSQAISGIDFEAGSYTGTAALKK